MDATTGAFSSDQDKKQLSDGGIATRKSTHPQLIKIKTRTDSGVFLFYKFRILSLLKNPQDFNWLDFWERDTHR